MLARVACRYAGKIQSFDYFYEAVAKGDLAAYTFLDPRWFTFFEWEASDQHPPHDVRPGEYLIAKVYQALRNGPKWNSTLFIVTYDEHGGYWDHVPTPFGAPRPDDVPNDEGFEFDRLGVRVPTIMASPWINKGTVIHAPPETHYEHSSLPATLKKLFNLPEFLTRRDAWAATFDHVVNQRYITLSLSHTAPPSQPTLNLVRARCLHTPETLRAPIAPPLCRCPGRRRSTTSGSSSRAPGSRPRESRPASSRAP
jgi:hypothetical protein